MKGGVTVATTTAIEAVVATVKVSTKVAIDGIWKHGDSKDGDDGWKNGGDGNRGVEGGNGNGDDSKGRLPRDEWR